MILICIVEHTIIAVINYYYYYYGVIDDARHKWHERLYVGIRVRL